MEVKLNMKFSKFLSKLSFSSSFILLATCIITITTSANISYSWKKNHKGWWYEDTNGNYPTNTWKLINGKWYFFDNIGYMVSQRWIGDYYLGIDGAMLTNTRTPDGYYVDSSGKWNPNITSTTMIKSGNRSRSSGSRSSSSSSGGSSSSSSSESSISNFNDSTANASYNNDLANPYYANSINSTHSNANHLLNPALVQLLAQDLSQEEASLYLAINEYRESLGLPKLSFSKSLTYVARTHVQDSNSNHPENLVDERGFKGNLHSWSYHPGWQGVVYTSDHKYAHLMWSKPSELTTYRGNGYEISAWASYNINTKDALDMWKNSPGHNDVIIGAKAWSTLKTMGVGINGNYAHVWFGSNIDPNGYYNINNYTVIYP